MAATYTRYEPNGTPVLVTDYSQRPSAPAPQTADRVGHDYHPVAAGEALGWAAVTALPFAVGALALNIGGGLARWLVDSPMTQHASFAAITLPAPWIVAGSAFVLVLLRFVRMRMEYERAMIDRFAPQVVGGDEETDAAIDAEDVAYAECVAVLKYAYANGGAAPVPRTDRNGVASLPLPYVGGALDGNEYTRVATLLRDRYGLMTGGSGKPWRLAGTWDTLAALLAEFETRHTRGVSSV